MKLNKIFLAILSLALFISSCGNKPEDLSHIPQNTDFVLTFNPQQFKSKSGIENFANTNIYKHIISSDTSDIDAQMLSKFHEFDYIFEDEKESGVDFTKQMFIYSMSNKNGYQTSFAINFGISSVDKFETLLKKATEKYKDSLIFSDNDGVNYMMSTKENNKGIIAWNDKTAIIYGVNKGMSYDKYLIERSVDLVNLSVSNSIAVNKSFVEFYENRKDISVWVNSDFIIGKIPKEYKTIVSMQMPLNPKGIEYRYYVSFEKGVAEIETELILPDDLKNFMSEYEIIKSEFDKDILSYVPANSIFNFSIALDAHEFYRMVKDLYKERQMNIDGMESLAEMSLDTDIEKIFEAINGEFIINVHDVNIKEYPKHDTVVHKDCNQKGFLNMKMSMFVKLDNDELYKLLLRQFNKHESKKVDGYYSLFDDDQPFYTTMVENIMIITNDESVVKNFVGGKSQNPSLKDTEVGKALDNYALYGKASLDYNSYGVDVQEYYDNKYSKHDMSKLRHKLKEIRLVPQDSYTNKVIIELKDKDRNSLEVLFNDKSE